MFLSSNINLATNIIEPTAKTTRTTPVQQHKTAETSATATATSVAMLAQAFSSRSRNVAAQRLGAMGRQALRRHGRKPFLAAPPAVGGRARAKPRSGTGAAPSATSRSIHAHDARRAGFPTSTANDEEGPGSNDYPRDGVNSAHLATSSTIAPTQASTP